MPCSPPPLVTGVEPHRAPSTCLRLWTPEDEWQVAAWLQGGTTPAGALAAELCVGVPGGRWPWGICGGCRLEAA
ncbi:hypothetical protein [Actinomadura opuntiae]|uniref:hypothetical protein n=1 Tax=Actinomadura sp. OS1-43 TaxID=604315 RepID=UPI00255A7D8A|nr:hypothetical protein [Actinomadura sp. OS1-43]MDL4817380.1 hypothetical protein [Actinomadura sp. OS1-43]